MINIFKNILKDNFIEVSNEIDDLKNENKKDEQKKNITYMKKKRKKYKTGIYQMLIHYIIG